MQYVLLRASMINEQKKTCTLQAIQLKFIKNISLPCSRATASQYVMRFPFKIVGSNCIKTQINTFIEHFLKVNTKTGVLCKNLC